MSAGLLVVALVSVGAGCRSKRDKNQLAQKVRSEAREKLNDSPPLIVKGTDNEFTVQDKRGKMILSAKVERVAGAVAQGQGLEGPVKMYKAKCRLYEDGKPHMDMESDEATWDGKQLSTQAPAHGVTTDGKMIVDGQRAVWTAETGHLDLKTAKLQAMKGKKVDFTAEGPHAEVHNRVATLNSGAKAYNPQGQQLTSRRAKWWLDTGILHADGDVVILDQQTRVTGEHLRSNTRLKRGKISGGTRVHMARAPVGKSGPKMAKRKNR
ncbi:MAG: hypothetical protein ACK47B_11700 [Armatimonadota bacterium]